MKNKESFQFDESMYHYKNENEVYDSILSMLEARTGLTPDDLSPAESVFLRSEMKKLLETKPVPEHRYSSEAVAGFLANYYGTDDMNILRKIAGGGREHSSVFNFATE